MLQSRKILVCQRMITCHEGQQREQTQLQEHVVSGFRVGMPPLGCTWCIYTKIGAHTLHPGHYGLFEEWQDYDFISPL